jgi:prepilin-type processing-associated H-X9-DG protein
MELGTKEMKKRLTFVLLAVLLLVLILLLVPNMVCSPHAGEEHRRAACACNLRQLGLALLEYRSVEGHFPPAVIRHEPSGCAHSWRVALLPYLGMRDLYSAYNLSEPWNSKANSDVTHAWPSVYVCPSDRNIQRECTNYLMVVASSVGNTSVCEKGAERGSIIIVEVKGANILWDEPRDIRSVEMSRQINDCSRLTISSDHPGGAHILHCDGSVEFIEETMPPAQVQQLLGEK